jgi:glc operon protein GlcG
MTLAIAAGQEQDDSMHITCRLSTAGMVLAFLVAPAVCAGQTPLGAAAASQIIEGCAAHAKAKGQSHAIAVYDAGGHPVALLKMDGNAPGVTEFAMQKASAVAHWHFSTSNMAAAARDTPGFGNAPHVVTVPGGIAVFSADGRQFIGAVGVSGEAPADDAACAEAGVKAAGLSSSSRKTDPVQ